MKQALKDKRSSVGTGEGQSLQTQKIKAYEQRHRHEPEHDRREAKLQGFSPEASGDEIATDALMPFKQLQSAGNRELLED